MNQDQINLAVAIVGTLVSATLTINFAVRIFNHYSKK
jgi:hypothetical protein